MKAFAGRTALCTVSIVLLIVLLTPSETEYSARAIAEARAQHEAQAHSQLPYLNNEATQFPNVKGTYNVKATVEIPFANVQPPQYSSTENHNTTFAKVKAAQPHSTNSTSIFDTIVATISNTLHSVSDTLRAAVLTVVPASEPWRYDNTAPPAAPVFPPEAGVLARSAIPADDAPVPSIPEHADWRPLVAAVVEPAPAATTEAVSKLADILAGLTNIVATLARGQGSDSIEVSDRILVSLSKSTNKRLPSSGGTLTGDLTGTTATFAELTIETFNSTNITATGTLTVTGTSGTTTIASGQGFTIGSSQFVVQQGSGNVGIGTASPGWQLDVQGTGVIAMRGINTSSSGSSAGAFLGLYSDDGAALASGNRLGGLFLGGSVDASHTLGGPIAITAFASENWSGSSNRGSDLVFEATPAGSGTRAEKMRIAGTGNVGIGTTSPWGKLSVTNTGTGPSFIVEDSTSPDTTPFIIDASGNVGIGTSSPWRTLAVTGTVGFDGLTGATGAGSLCLDSNKQVVYNSGTDACLSSLRATKHDITELMLSGTELIAALSPVSFVYNNDASSTVRYGFIAEDAAAVDPRFATRDAAGKLSGIDDRGVIAALVKALQELIGELRSLAATVAGFARSFVSDDITANNRLCVGTTCITESELKALLRESNTRAAPNIAPAQPPAEPPAPSATSTPPAPETPTPDDTMSSDTTPTDEPNEPEEPDQADIAPEPSAAPEGPEAPTAAPAGE